MRFAIRYLGMSCDFVSLLWARWHHQLRHFSLTALATHGITLYRFISLYLIASICLAFVLDHFAGIPFGHLFQIRSATVSQQPQMQLQLQLRQTIEVMHTETLVNGWKLMGIARWLKYTFKLQMLLYCFENYTKRTNRSGVYHLQCEVEKLNFRQMADNKRRRRRRQRPTDQPFEWLKFQANCHSTCTSKCTHDTKIDTNPIGPVHRNRKQ